MDQSILDLRVFPKYIQSHFQIYVSFLNPHSLGIFCMHFGALKTVI